MEFILLIVMLAGEPEPRRFGNVTDACRYYHTNYDRTPHRLFRNTVDGEGRPVRIRMRCLAPVVTPERTVQVVEPATTAYPSEEI